MAQLVESSREKVEMELKVDESSQEVVRKASQEAVRKSSRESGKEALDETEVKRKEGKTETEGETPEGSKAEEPKTSERKLSFKSKMSLLCNEEVKHAPSTIEAIAALGLHDRKKSVMTMLNNTMRGIREALKSGSSPEEHIFELFVANNDPEVASLSKMIRFLKSFGIQEADPRLKKVIAFMKSRDDGLHDDNSKFKVDRQTFCELIHPLLTTFSQAFRNAFIIPNWADFCGIVKDIYEEVQNVESGDVATYIPQLARQDPDIWGVSICTIDGQRVSFGNSKKPFCLQSVSKAFNYAIVSSDLGAEQVHKWVGYEPSGRLFNDICLDPNGKPHNPMINAGAIIVTSLIKNTQTMADRFDYMMTQYKKLAGGEHVGFDNATFLSERETADRNYALSYYMKENKCFPQNQEGKPGEREQQWKLREELDLYFQLCSLEANCETASVMAATLANGGICPLTNERCIDQLTCRNVLSLMYSCGMYDYSGKFAFSVGLPAKSGVSGGMVVVIPNLMGICLFSPRLDKMGNSTRGVAFCKKLVERFNFHNYDSILHNSTQKQDPRRNVLTHTMEPVISLLFAAQYGDFDAVKQMYNEGIRMDQRDYDGRTALHVAASAGHMEIVKFLVADCGLRVAVKDRWDRTAIEDARHFKHHAVQEYLMQAYTDQLNSKGKDAEEEKNKAERESEKESEGSVRSEDTSTDVNEESGMEGEENKEREKSGTATPASEADTTTASEGDEELKEPTVSVIVSEPEDDGTVVEGNEEINADSDGSPRNVRNRVNKMSVTLEEDEEVVVRDGGSESRV